MRVVPINVAEAIIEPFWDPSLSGLKYWRVEDGGGHGLRVSQNWCWVTYEWTGKPAAGPALRMSRRFGIDCSAYDRLLVAMLLPQGGRLTVMVATDKGTVRFQSPPAPPEKQEYELELGGATRLEEVTLEIEAAGDGMAMGWLNWIGLAHSRLRDQMLARRPKYDPQWEGYIRGEDYQPAFEPSYGLVLAGEELRQLRTKHDELIRAGGVSPFIQAGQAALAEKPEENINDYVNWWMDTRYNRQRDYGKSLLTHGINAAVAGHLLRDASMLRMAARFAMSIGLCEHWEDGFISCFPGSTFEERCFMQSLCAYELAAILDLAGEMFTSLGRDFLFRRISEQAVASINYNTWRHEYIFHCNQLAWFSTGRILALAVLGKRWPRVEPYLDIAYRELVESLDLTILGDGGYVEGPTYFTCVGSYAGKALYHYSRAKGKSLAEAVPDSMRRCGDFAEAIISTDTSTDVIPICDSGATHAMFSQAMMANILPRSAWARMLRKTLARQDGWPGDPVHQATQVPDMLAAAIAWQLAGSLPPDTAPPAAVHLADMGVLASHRDLGGLPVKLFIQGNRAAAGHAHEDKGSFVLEFAGDTFAMDPGTCRYDSPFSLIVKQCQRHNMLIPVVGGQRPGPENPLPADVKPTGTGDAVSFHAAIDATPGWQPYYKRWRRTWDSPDPANLVITDEYELASGEGVDFLWHTRLPVRVSGNTITLTGRLGQAAIQAPADCSVRVEDLPLVEGVQRCIAIRRTGASGTLRVSVTLSPRTDVR
jgi:hypothetical protein